MTCDRIHQRCCDPERGDYCSEVDLRLAAAAQMIAEGCWTHAGGLFTTAARIVEVHRQESELLERGTT